MSNLRRPQWPTFHFTFAPSTLPRLAPQKSLGFGQGCTTTCVRSFGSGWKNTASAASNACTAEKPTESRNPRIRLPAGLMELLEITIFSFAGISGLHSMDKVRGDPILKGVCAMFAQLLSCASPETTEALLQPTTQARMVKWTPGKEPSPELLTLTSSKLKAMKAQGQL